MKRRESLIYQARKVESPWAIKIEATRQGKRTCANVTVFADWLRSESKELILFGYSLDNPRIFLTQIDNVLSYYGHGLNQTDKRQILDEARHLLRQFRD